MLDNFKFLARVLLLQYTNHQSREHVMNSQIFQNTRCKKSINAGTSNAILGASPAIQWLSAALLIMAVILYPERPAWGYDFEINIGPNGIQGHAHGVELIDVLEVLADEGGYTFYIDDEMAETLISFSIPDAVTAEYAIGQIIHPYSHAIIFGKAPNSHILKIEQVRIYYQNPGTITAEIEPPPSTDELVDPAVHGQDQDPPQMLASAE